MHLIDSEIYVPRWRITFRLAKRLVFFRDDFIGSMGLVYMNMYMYGIYKHPTFYRKKATIHVGIYKHGTLIRYSKNSIGSNGLCCCPVMMIFFMNLIGQKWVTVGC